MGEKRKRSGLAKEVRNRRGCFVDWREQLDFSKKMISAS